MSTTDRALLRRVREHLDEWTFDARDRAYADLFEGEDAVLTGEELRLLDRIDSDLARASGEGLWAADEYGIVGESPDADGLQVVCIYHPAIPYEGYRGAGSVDEATREELNDVLWEYGERVAGHVQEDLDAFLRRAGQGEE